MIGNSTPTLFSARAPSFRAAAGVSGRQERSGWTDLSGVEQWVARHPVVCVSSALLLGAMVGWLIKRR
jgi:hypothetical protein